MQLLIRWLHRLLQILNISMQLLNISSQARFFHFHDRMHFNEGYDGNPVRAKLIMSLAWRLSFVARCWAMPFGFSGAFVLLTTETSLRHPKL